MDAVQEAIDYDVAIDLIAKMRVMAIRRRNSAISDKERQTAMEEIRIYNAEERVLNGIATDDAKQSVYDKVFRFYSPIIKAR